MRVAVWLRVAGACGEMCSSDGLVVLRREQQRVVETRMDNRREENQARFAKRADVLGRQLACACAGLAPDGSPLRGMTRLG